MFLSKLFENDWLVVARYSLPANTGLMFEPPATTNAQFANYIVYGKGELRFYNAANELVVVRQAGETTDTTPVTLSSIELLTAEAGADGAEFFCVSKTVAQPVNRAAHQLIDAQAFVPSNPTVFVASGSIRRAGAVIDGPVVLEDVGGEELTAVGPVFLAEVWQ